MKMDTFSGSMKCILVTVLLLSLSVEPTWSTCSAPLPIKSGTILPPNPKPNPVTGKYPENAEAKVECNAGFRLSVPDAPNLICTNGEWKQHGVKADESICVPVQCGRPPPIEHGYYTSEKTRFKLGDKAGETYPFGTFLIPGCDMGYTINCTVSCGKITCGADGSWLPRDGTFISQCVAQALRTTNSASSHEDRGETGLKHYLIIVLAVICILIVGALTVMLLRRPTFCKKHGGRSTSGTGSSSMAGNNFNPNLLRSCEDSSVSPVPANLDSLPVAMNTGIFVPGGSYDWQECSFQESTLTGTSVFK